MTPRRTAATPSNQLDLFSSTSDPQLALTLGQMPWPDSTRFPVNHAGARVRELVWPDLLTAADPLAVAGFASIAQLVDLVSAISGRTMPPRLRLLLGTEPFSTDRVAFGAPDALFTEEVRRYWTEDQNVSLRLSAKVVQAMRAVDDGWLEVRFIPGSTRLHAKLYIGSRAATVGSSNFTDAGLRAQFEANARFERAGAERVRYDETRTMAENYWHAGQDWSKQFRDLLAGLLQVVSWQDALARACADLLEGQWASKYLATTTEMSDLWPSQVAGIAEALWVVENVGSVLVADATGSGKTRMGAYLTRAVRDRLWSTGRVRRDLTVLVCPPAVEPAWQREALRCGLTLRTVSQGMLSRSSPTGRRVQADEVASAQILAIDEAHNFLAQDSNRTREVRDAPADHVLMFTATPINRGATDLLSLVDLLGADNFQDESLELLDRLMRRGSADTLADPERDLLRAEIQRFTVRRTKTMLNAMVDQAPDKYLHPETGRPSRYPRHDIKSYPTQESAHDERIAEQITAEARALRGLNTFGERIYVPESRRREFTDERWLQLRIDSAAGLAAYHVRSSLRSSRAALVEHVAGTAAAVTQFALHGLAKTQPTGNMLKRIADLIEREPPAVDLTCAVPAWLTDVDLWREECEAEVQRYKRILTLATQLSERRERAKAQLITQLTPRHQRVLAFDHHPITLAVIDNLLDIPDVPVYAATGAATAARRQVKERFARTSTKPGVALCSDAMNEGINLQGASVVVHFDVPTTLRVAEQRVGRVDRMDSPYDSIEVWWPADGPSFETRADDMLQARNDESASLLGSNLPIPRRDIERNVVVTPDTFRTTDQQLQWDGLRDALEPVRSLVAGPNALLSRQVYDSQRDSTHRVMARISTSTVRTDHPWAFFAIRGTTTGAPRWLLLDGYGATPITGLEAITGRLRDLLADDPPSRDFDEACSAMLDRFLTAAASVESQLLPRVSQRALHQMRTMCDLWATATRASMNHGEADRWHQLARLAAPVGDRPSPDPHQVATEWLRLVQPVRRAVRSRAPNRRYSRLTDIDPALRAEPLHLGDVEAAMSGLPVTEPLDQRVSACILSVPD